MISQLLSRFQLENDPLLAVALAAALLALATTPLAFAILARMNWFQARRGRVLQKPGFASVVCGMLLVMGIPAIFSLMTIKSRYYDRDRYEFDPNRTLSVLDRGRQFASLKAADDAVRAEAKRLDDKEKALLNAVKKFDDAFLAMRDRAVQHPATYQALPPALNALAEIHKAVGLDAPQQLMNLTAPPAAIAQGGAPAVPVMVAAAPNAVAAAPGVAAAPAAVPASSGGITQAEADAEVASVPEAQRSIAAQLPLTDVPAGWVLDKQGQKHLESFTSENLYEKIDGRAESFLPFHVLGMTYCTYHLASDESQEVQLYIYDFAFDPNNPLNAFGKYASEKPDEAKPIALGKEGYTAAGSAFYYVGRYYTQVISATDDPKAAAFALEIAKKVAAKQSSVMTADAAASGSPEPTGASPETIFKLLPQAPGRSGDKYFATDVFGYSFLTNVFGSDYKDGGVTWQGFVRPYASPEEAAEAFKKYVATVKSFDAKVKTVDGTEADGMVTSELDGLFDAVFYKGNCLAGANGATAMAPVEAFARGFAKDLPKSVAASPSSATAAPKPSQGAEGGEK